MPMTTEQSRWYKAIKAADQLVAEAFVTWATHMRDAAEGPLAPQGKRGAVVGRLEEVLGILDGATDGNYKARHIFLYALTNTITSTKQLSEGQADYLLGLLSERVGDEWRVNADTATQVRAATIALIKDGIQQQIGGQAMPNPTVPQAVAAPKRTPPQHAKPAAKPAAKAPTPPSDAPPEDETPVVGNLNVTEDILNAGMDEVKETTWHAEAPLSATVIVDVNGYEWMVTLRAGVTGTMMIGFTEMVRRATNFMARAGMLPVSRGSGGGARGGGGGASNSTPVRGSTEPGVVDSGTKLIEYIQTDAKGKVQFKLEGLEYTLNDSRGATTVAGLCDPETGLTAEFFEPGMLLSSNWIAEEIGQPLYADWIKKIIQRGDETKTYWDVTRVHL